MDLGLPPEVPTLPSLLRQAGYATALVGKWHLGSEPAMHPQQRGFQEFFGFLGGSHDYFHSGQMLRGTTPAKGSPPLASTIASASTDLATASAS